MKLRVKSKFDDRKPQLNFSVAGVPLSTKLHGAFRRFVEKRALVSELVEVVPDGETNATDIWMELPLADASLATFDVCAQSVKKMIVYKVEDIEDFDGAAIGLAPCHAVFDSAIGLCSCGFNVSFVCLFFFALTVGAGLAFFHLWCCRQCSRLWRWRN